MLKYETVVWDWNGTLLDDGAYTVGIVNRLLAAHGKAAKSLAEHRALFDFPLALYYERLGFESAGPEYEAISTEFVRQFYEGVWDGCGLVAGAEGVLQRLGAAGVGQWILSASHQSGLEKMIAHYGLGAYFAGLLGIDSIHAPGKKGRGCEWIAGSGLDVTRVLMVGDTLHDYEVAEAMGVDCCLVSYGHHGAERLRGTGCPIVDGIEGVCALVGL